MFVKSIRGYNRWKICSKNKRYDFLILFYLLCIILYSFLFLSYSVVTHFASLFQRNVVFCISYYKLLQQGFNSILCYFILFYFILIYFLGLPVFHMIGQRLFTGRVAVAQAGKYCAYVRQFSTLFFFKYCE